MPAKRKTALRFGVSWFGITALIGAPSVATAQEATTDEDNELSLEEIIVTARKRSQRLQDVPLAVQAFDTNAIREKGLRDFQDYARELTSVSFGTSSPGATTIAFRGALSQPTGFDTISSSILYLDEVPITRDGQNPDVRLIDVERLEALSGPQPTVYGAGSQSGTLKIVTNKPNTEEFGGWVEAGASTTRFGEESFDISGAVNIPITEDKLAVRLVGFYEYEGGYIDNVLGTTSAYSVNNGDRDNADQVEDDINDYEVYGARANFLFKPTEDWSITAGIIYQSATLDNLFDFNPAFGDLNTIKFKEENREDDWYNLALTIEGDLGFANLVAASGYHSRIIDYDVDSTAYMTAYRDAGLDLVAYYTGTPAFTDYATCSAYYICFVNYNDFGPNPTGTISLDQRVRSFVQEVRLTSKEDSGSRLSWVAGAFYERTNNDWDYLSRVDDFDEFGGIGGSVFTYYGVAPTEDWFDQGFREGQTYGGLPGNDFNGYRGDIESIAFFGEITYDLTDTLSISAGGRWFSTDFRVAENSLFVGNVSDSFDETQTTKDFSPRINLTYNNGEGFLAYATYSEGARIGGRNGGVQTPAQRAIAPDAFDGDVLRNYEAGIKASWMGGRLITNITGFMMNWEDFQVQTLLPLAGATIVNAGNASIDGFEAQLAFKATQNLEVSFAVSHIDATLDEDVILADGAVIAGLAGDRLPATPRWQMSGGLQYTTDLPWNDLEGFSRFDWSYTGSSVNGTQASVGLFGAGSTVPQFQPSYNIGDLTFGVRSTEGLEVWLSINNLWDERAITYIWPRFQDNRVFTVRPREIRVGIYKPF